MVRVRYIALALCGLLISGGGPAEAQGGWGRGPSLATNGPFPQNNNGPFDQIPQGYHQIPRTAGAGNPYGSSSPGQDPLQTPVGRGLVPRGPDNPYSPQLRHSCTINANQPDAGDACLISGPPRIYSGDRCRCGRQYGTID